MPIMVRATPLSVVFEIEPNRESIIYVMATTSRRALSFDMGEPMSDHAVALRRLDTGSLVLDAIEGSSIEIDQIVVTVSNLERGVTYELLVTPTFGDGERDPRTLFIECVA